MNKEDLMNDPKYHEFHEKYLEKKKKKEEEKFKPQGIINEYHYGETKRIV